MKNIWIITLLIGYGILTLNGCSHTAADKKLDDKIAIIDRQSQSMPVSATLKMESTNLIENSPDLTADQKARLTSIREKTQNEMEALKDESIKLRLVLIRDVLAPKYNAKEVKIIKNRMKGIENKKLELTFKSVDEANKVLGRNATARQDVVQEMFSPRGVARD